MDVMFVAVTLGSLVLAIAMSLVGWKLLRADRARSDARVDGLQALALAGTDDGLAFAAAGPSPTATPVATRFASLEDDAPAGWDALHHTPRHAFEVVDPEPSAGPSFGATTHAASAPDRRWLVFATVAVVMMAAGAGVYARYRPRTTPAAQATIPASDTTTAADVAAARPLELLSLRHANVADGTFEVTGLIGNPTDGRSLHGIVAVVYLFDKDGNYFASNRQAIDLPALQPGDQSPFVVRIANAAGVARYRVGFRLMDGAVVAHVDHRGQAAQGLTEGTPTPATPSTAPSGHVVHGTPGA